MPDQVDSTADFRHRPSHLNIASHKNDIESQLPRVKGPLSCDLETDVILQQSDTPTRPFLFSPHKRPAAMMLAANTFAPTRRELVLIITFALVFMLVQQLDYSRVDPAGPRSLRFNGHWPFSDSASDYEIHPGKTAAAFGQLIADDDDAEWKQLLEEEGVLERLYGTNDLGSIAYEGVGRWKEPTMNDSLVNWGDKSAPQTETVAHAPGEFVSLASQRLRLFFVHRMDHLPQCLSAQRDVVHRHGQPVRISATSHDDIVWSRDLE